MNVMAGGNPSGCPPVTSGAPSQSPAPKGDPMQPALQNMETVCGKKHGSGLSVNVDARFNCLAAFGDYCTLNRAPSEEARTKLRARLAQNCGVLQGIGAAGKCSYCR